MIKAIDTRYKGYRFRSRLEARWAVVFDRLGLTWQYESEGFDLGSAGWYLPDFYLSESKRYLEIKPDIPTRDEFRKMWELARQHNSRRKIPSYHYLICGSPGNPKLIMSALNNDGGFNLSLKDGYAIFATAGNSLLQIPHFQIQCFCVRGDKDRDPEINTMLFPKIVNPPGVLTPKDVGEGPRDAFSLCTNGFIDTIYMGPGRRFYDQRLLKAYEAGRSARFEHGEKGEPK